ncbi:unnamed protein product [Litomosoides sigmodontis]|uniref:Tyrosine-protein phosphatase domain-containing protein n=1 Tax=Litomosoides sigmodontis TaxID=42156 RepID=A0A3P6SU00_LITSI|nr:unnamed protein product [Litomosoides sigmodontis]
MFDERSLSLFHKIYPNRLICQLPAAQRSSKALLTTAPTILLAMNKLVQKVAASMKFRKTSTEQKSSNVEKEDKKDGKEQQKTAEKRRRKTFFKILGKKKEDYSSLSTKTQISVLDESAEITKEMNKLKKELTDGPARDQTSKWSDALLDKGIAGLEMELEKLNKTVEKIEAKGFDANAERNLSQDIICQDKGRILLKNDANNYIHANYVNTPKFVKHFICTQRPMQATIESFYKMLLQEEVQCVVMLGPFTESTGKNCPPYFPQSSTEKPMKFGSIAIKCIVADKMKEEPDITITTLGITAASNKQYVVKHYNWKSWPERGFPDPSSTVFHLICAIRNFKKPIVVHCSDGVGRSGVFVAIEYVLQKLAKGENCADLVEVVKEIRNQRAMAISNSSNLISLICHSACLNLSMTTMHTRENRKFNETDE